MLKAITVKQPFGTLIVRGIKLVENRTWQTHHRGLIAIHTSGTMADQDGREFALAVLRRSGRSLAEFEPFDRGFVIGVAKLTSVVERMRSPWFTGPYGFVMQEPVMFEKPIRCPGALNVWTLPASVEEQVRARL